MSLDLVDKMEELLNNVTEIENSLVDQLRPHSSDLFDQTHISCTSSLIIE